MEQISNLTQDNHLQGDPYKTKCPPGYYHNGFFTTQVCTTEMLGRQKFGKNFTWVTNRSVKYVTLRKITLHSIFFPPCNFPIFSNSL